MRRFPLVPAHLLSATSRAPARRREPERIKNDEGSTEAGDIQAALALALPRLEAGRLL
jgi:hypothetical protein